MRTLIGVIAAAVMFGGCTKAAPDASRAQTHNPYTVPHTLRIGDVADVNSLDPHLETSLPLGNLSELTMAYLVRYDRQNRPIPELATEVPTRKNHLISRDGLTITWHLRHGVSWSDGARFDADDVVFSTRAVNNPRNNEVGRDGFDLIVKIDEPDKYTVVYHLKKPYSGFLPTFFGSAGANPCLLPKHLLGKLSTINNADYNAKPIGIGPFRYTRWVRGDRVELEPNPSYWRGVPKLKRIIYKFIPDRNTLLTQIQTGEIDLWTQVGLGFYDRVAALPNVRTIHHPGYLYTHLDFNGARPLFREKAVREALRLAADRRTMRDKVQHGLGGLQEGALTPASPLYTALPLVPFDINKANARLERAGWKRGADGVREKAGKRLAFDVAVTTGQPDLDEVIELLRSTWERIGVHIDVSHHSSTLMFGQPNGVIYGGKFDAVLFVWEVTPDGDLSTTDECAQIPPNGQNILHYCNPKTDALLARAKAAYDNDERKPILAAIQKQIIADVPNIVLWVRDDIFTYNRDLRGWQPNATTPYDDMLDVDI